MRRTVVVLAVGALLAAAAPQGRASGLDFRLGAYFPKAESNLFQDTAELFGTTKGDWIGITGGMEYGASLNRHLELTVGVDVYYRSMDTSYRDFVRPGGADIFQTLRLTNVPVSVGVKWVANPRRGAFTPYLVAGGDAFFWEYEEFGDFIDFQDPGRAIYPDHFHSDGVAWGFHAGAGLKVPLNEDMNITFEGRYNFAGEQQMEEDFFRNRIDVGGVAATVGLNIRF